MTTEQRLAELGYANIFSGTWELCLPDVQWQIVSDHYAYTFYEWTGSMWRMLAVVTDGDFLVTMIEAIGARDV